MSETDATPRPYRAGQPGLLKPLWTEIGGRAPIVAPLVAVTLVSFATSLAMRPALAQALVGQGQAVVASAIFAVWLAAVLSPVFALAKAAALAATGWALATLGGRDVRLRPLLSLLLFGQVVIVVRDVVVAAALYWRGLDAIAAPADLLVPTGLDLLLPNLGPVSQAVVQSTGAFDLLWVAFVVLGLERVLRLRRRDAVLCAGAFWTVRRGVRYTARDAARMSIRHRVPQQRETMTPVLALQDFSVRFPTFTLYPLSLTLRAGERVALVGPNGAGKTTAMKGLAGRLPNYQGAVQFGGVEIRTLLPDVRAKIGFLPETLCAYGWMSVAEHLEFLAAFYPSWDRAYAAELAARLDLSLDHKVGTLSKGTKVKLSFVAAEAFRPPVLLLDEPTSGLDPVVRRELIDAIAERFPSSSERLVVFSTHLLEDVEWLANRVLVLAGGVLRADTTVAELRRGHAAEPLSHILYALLSNDRTPPLRRAAEG